MTLYELGVALKEARIQQSLTQSDLADRTGVSVSTISGLERGSLPEIGIVKVLQLFAAVGLDLQPGRVGARRTLDDIKEEQSRAGHSANFGTPSIRLKTSYSVQSTDSLSEPGSQARTRLRQRVRHVAGKQDKKP